MKAVWAYAVRLLIALCLVLPATATVIVIAGRADTTESATLAQLVQFWFGFVYLYATIPVVGVSLLHTAVSRQVPFAGPAYRAFASSMLGLILGGLGGWLVSLLVLWRTEATIAGVAAGFVYGIVIGVLDRASTHREPPAASGVGVGVAS